MEKAKFRISKHKAQCIEWYVEKVEEEICMQKWARAKYQPSIPLGDHNQRVTASPAHIALSKEAAKEGMVLLKNNGNILPLQKGGESGAFWKSNI